MFIVALISAIAISSTALTGSLTPNPLAFVSGFTNVASESKQEIKISSEEHRVITKSSLKLKINES